MISTLTLDTLEISPELAQRGLTLRNWRENADYQKLSPVLIASRNADGFEEARSGDALQHMYEHTHNFDPTRNLFLMEHDGELVGYAGCRWSQEISGDSVYMHWIYLLPAWRGKGIENELLQQTQNRLLQQAQTHLSDTGNWFEAFAADTQTWLIALLIADGFQPVRYFYEMVCHELNNLPDAPLPSGIETRPVTPEQLRQIWDTEGEAFAEHWGETIPNESDYQRWLSNPLNDIALWQVAWEGDQIVGMVLNYIDHNENSRYGFKRGYTENISVRKEWRKRGIARALLLKSMKMFRDMGCDHTALGVDTENATGALRVYEGVGYKTIRNQASYRRRF